MRTSSSIDGWQPAPGPPCETKTARPEQQHAQKVEWTKYDDRDGNYRSDRDRDTKMRYEACARLSHAVVPLN
jgi:hypothetical protein